MTYYVFLVPVHYLSNIEITKYFNHEPRFNGVFSRHNFPRIKDEAYIINLNYKKTNGTHWVSLFIEKITAAFSDSFGIKALSKAKDKSITHNIFRIQDNDFMMCFCLITNFI